MHRGVYELDGRRPVLVSKEVLKQTFDHSVSRDFGIRGPQSRNVFEVCLRQFFGSIDAIPQREERFRVPYPFVWF